MKWPPLTVAAMGPRMMRYAATHADTWNTMSFGAGAETLLQDAATLKDKMAAACDSVGRYPASLRHSFLLFDADARESSGRLFYWDDAAAFEDLSGQLFAMGSTRSPCTTRPILSARRLKTLQPT